MIVIEKLFLILSAIIFFHTVSAAAAEGIFHSITRNTYANNDVRFLRHSINIINVNEQVQYDNNGNRMLLLTTNKRFLQGGKAETYPSASECDKDNTSYPLGACVEDGKIVCAIGPENCLQGAPYIPSSSLENEEFKCLLCNSNDDDESKSDDDDVLVTPPNGYQDGGKDEEAAAYYLEGIKNDEDNDCRKVFPVGGCRSYGIVTCATGAQQCLEGSEWVPVNSDLFDTFQCYLCRGTQNQYVEDKDPDDVDDDSFDSDDDASSSSDKDPDDVDDDSHDSDDDTSSSSDEDDFSSSDDDNYAATISEEPDEYGYFLKGINPRKDGDDECEKVTQVGGCLNDGSVDCATVPGECPEDEKWLSPNSSMFTRNFQCFLCRGNRKELEIYDDLPEVYTYTLKGISLNDEMGDEKCDKVLLVGGCSYDGVVSCSTDPEHCLEDEKWLPSSADEFTQFQCYLCRNEGRKNNQEVSSPDGNDDDNVSSSTGDITYEDKEEPDEYGYYLEYINTDDDDCEKVAQVGGCLRNEEIDLDCATVPGECLEGEKWLPPDSDMFTSDFQCYLCRGKRSELDVFNGKSQEVKTYSLTGINRSDEKDDDKCDRVFVVGGCSYDGAVSCATDPDQCLEDEKWLSSGADEFSDLQCYLCRDKAKKKGDDTSWLFESAPVDPPQKVSSPDSNDDDNLIDNGDGRDDDYISSSEDTSHGDQEEPDEYGYFLEGIDPYGDEDKGDCEKVTQVGGCLRNGEIECATVPGECFEDEKWLPPDSDMFTSDFQCYLCRGKRKDLDIFNDEPPEVNTYNLKGVTLNDEKDDDKCDMVFVVGGCSYNGVVSCATDPLQCLTDEEWLPSSSSHFSGNFQCYLCRDRKKKKEEDENPLFETAPVDPPQKVTADFAAPVTSPIENYIATEEELYFFKTVDRNQRDPPTDCPGAKKAGGCMSLTDGSMRYCILNEKFCDDGSFYIEDDLFPNNYDATCYRCDKKDALSEETDASSEEQEEEDENLFYKAVSIERENPPEDCLGATKVGGCMSTLDGALMRCAMNEQFCNDGMNLFLEVGEFAQNYINVQCYVCHKKKEKPDLTADFPLLGGNFYFEQYGGNGEEGNRPPPNCVNPLRVGGCRDMNSGEITSCAFEEHECSVIHPVKDVETFVPSSQFTFGDKFCYLCSDRGNSDSGDGSDDDDGNLINDSSTQPSDDGFDDDHTGESNVGTSVSMGDAGDFYLVQYAGDQPPDCPRFMKVGGCRNSEKQGGEITRCAFAANTCGDDTSYVGQDDFRSNDDNCFLCRSEEDSQAITRPPTRAPTRPPTRVPTKASTIGEGSTTSAPFKVEVTQKPQSVTRLPPPPSFANGGDPSSNEVFELMGNRLDDNDDDEEDEGSGFLMNSLIIILFIASTVIFGMAFMIRQRREKKAMAEATGIGLPDNLMGGEMT